MSNPSDKSTELFHTSPAYGAGFVQGMGTGIVMMAIAIQLPQAQSQRVVEMIVGVGLFAFAVGTYRCWKNYQNWKKEHTA